MEQEEKDKETINAQVENPESENEEGKQEIVSENEGQEKSLDETEVLKKELAEQKDKYLRMYSEFENFRRRTAKEKMDLLKTANEDALASLLPVLDDFERAMKSMGEAKETDAVKEGINLIYNKLKKTLESKGLKPMETKGTEFNPDLHEAITQVPAPSEELKGKVVDELEKGYYLHDKVIRFAKVIIGS